MEPIRTDLQYFEPTHTISRPRFFIASLHIAGSATYT